MMVKPLKRVTMFDVLVALDRKPDGSLAADLEIRASVQAISNALRHAGYRGWVDRFYLNETARMRNIAVWFITGTGRAQLRRGSA